jgi:hypothetical protein
MRFSRVDNGVVVYYEFSRIVSLVCVSKNNHRALVFELFKWLLKKGFQIITGLQ